MKKPQQIMWSLPTDRHKRTAQLRRETIDGQDE